MKRRVVCSLAMLLLTAGGCDAPEEVDVQPLPSLTRPSPEARAGLPEVAGVWHYAGWELAPEDSALLGSEPARLGALQLRTQRLDSLAGYYAAGEGRVPLIGEVRRDNLISLVTAGGAGARRFLAGRVQRDTLWVNLTSLVGSESWPTGARVAFVREPVGSPFVRLEGVAAREAVADTAPVIALPEGVEAEEPARAEIARPPRREAEVAEPTPEPRRAEPAPVAPEPERRAPPVLQPDQPQPVQPAPEPEPREPEPAESPILLGEPVVRDTVGG